MEVHRQVQRRRGLVSFLDDEITFNLQRPYPSCTGSNSPQELHTVGDALSLSREEVSGLLVKEHKVLSTFDTTGVRKERRESAENLPACRVESN